MVMIIRLDGYGVTFAFTLPKADKVLDADRVN